MLRKFYFVQGCSKQVYGNVPFVACRRSDQVNLVAGFSIEIAIQKSVRGRMCNGKFQMLIPKIATDGLCECFFRVA